MLVMCCKQFIELDVYGIYLGFRRVQHNFHATLNAQMLV